MKTLSASSRLLLAGAALAPVALAQTAVTDRLAAPDPLAGEIRPATDEALHEDGGDPAALIRSERAWRSRLSIDNELAYQSNAEFDGRGGESDFVWFPSVAGSATYRVSDLLSIEGRAALQSGVYADLTELDFWGVTGEVLARRGLGADWSVYGGVEAYDYQALENGDSLSRALAPAAGFTYQRYYAASRTSAFADIGVKHRYTNPASDERDEFKLALGVTRQIADQVYAQGYYEYRYANYEEGGREDQRHFLGASLIYLFSDSLRASLGVSFIDNNSNQPGADYQTFNAGLGTSVSWEF
jgi:hypothetical protein